jgi:rhamnogalacturonan endolyase
MINGDCPVNFPSYETVDTVRFEGSIRLIGDVLGDWREEFVTSHNGEIRIYTTTIPATDCRNTFLQDPNYRATLRESTMGYPQIPIPSYELK